MNNIKIEVLHNVAIYRTKGQHHYVKTLRHGKVVKVIGIIRVGNRHKQKTVLKLADGKYISGDLNNIKLINHNHKANHHSKLVKLAHHTYIYGRNMIIRKHGQITTHHIKWIHYGAHHIVIKLNNGERVRFTK